MPSKSRLATACVVGSILVGAFFTGRTVQQKAVAAKATSDLPVPIRDVAPSESPKPSHRQLTGAEIARLPFAEFYEALRTAPGEARQKWLSELATLPESPLRAAAVSGFYKLLVQFDPSATLKAIREIEDVGLQRLALSAAVDAAPGFVLPRLAELTLSLQDRIPDKRDCVSDVISEWGRIDPPAAARFIDDNDEAFHNLSIGGRYIAEHQVISAGAALDPAAAKEWIEKNGHWEESHESREAFIVGWYENDRAAAVSFTLAHADEPPMIGAIGYLTRALYYDSRDEATTFIQSLPEEARADALTDAFHNVMLLEQLDTGEPTVTPEAIDAWMVEFPPAYWKGAIGRLFQYSASGPAGMLTWIQQLPPALREQAAAEYWPSFDQSTSEQFMPLLRVADPTLQNQLLRAALTIGQPDFSEARATINAAPLSAAQKGQLLQTVAAVEAEKQ